MEKMADTWFTSVIHLLDDNGEILSEPSQARKRGEYLTAIIFMAPYDQPAFRQSGERR